MNFAYRNVGHATVPIWQWWLTVIIARWRYWFIRSENHNKKMDDSPGASLEHDDWGVLIFSRRKFTIYPTDGTPASCIPTKPSSNSRRQGIFQTRTIYFPENTLSNQYPDHTQVLETTRQTPACVITKLVLFYPISKKYHEAVAPTHPMVTPLTKHICACLSLR